MNQDIESRYGNNILSYRICFVPKILASEMLTRPSFWEDIFSIWAAARLVKIFLKEWAQDINLFCNMIYIKTMNQDIESRYGNKILKQDSAIKARYNLRH